MRRYSAAIAIVKEAIKKNLTIHEAYAFALTSEPLLDKQEEENGYSIQKDVAKIWRRETGIKPSGTITADDILSAHQPDDARNKTRDRKSIVQGKSVSVSVDLGGPRVIKKKNTHKHHTNI